MKQRAVFPEAREPVRLHVERVEQPDARLHAEDGQHVRLAFIRRPPVRALRLQLHPEQQEPPALAPEPVSLKLETDAARARLALARLGETLERNRPVRARVPFKV